MPSRLNKSTNSSARMESKLQLRTMRLAIFIGTSLFLSILNETNCLDQAELQQQQQQQQPQQSISQATYGSGPDYASLVAGAENLLNLPVYNNKRARKMSAFMPMRGRKDGRDFLFQQRQQPQQQLTSFERADGSEMLLAGPYQEAEGDSSIMRLVGASALNNEPNWLAGTSAPRQFTNQLRHMLVNGANNVGLGGGQQPLQRAFLPSSQVFGPMQSSGDLMQAKPRRAFHPMRGKKSSSMPVSSFEVAADEISADLV